MIKTVAKYITIILLFTGLNAYAADKKITDLTELNEAPASDDIVPVVDVSDPTDSAIGTTKKLTVSNLQSGTVNKTDLDSDLSSTSANHDTAPSAKETKEELDKKANAASPAFTVQATLDNGFIIKPAAGTNGHYYIFQGYGSTGLENAVKIENDTSGNVKTTLTGNVSVPQMHPDPVTGDPDSVTVPTRTYTNGGTIIFNAAGTFAMPAATSGYHFTTINNAANAVLCNPNATGTEDTIVLYKPSAGTYTTLTQGQAASFASKIGAISWEYLAADTWLAICTADVVGE